MKICRAAILLVVALVPFVESAEAEEIDARGRFAWLLKSTAGPPSLAGGVISTAWGTMYQDPDDHSNFAQRYGIRLTGVATSNTMEAGLGAVWGEDPRYPRAAGQPFGSRVRNIAKMTVLARNREGNLMPAYARYAAIPGSNFLSNAWRPDPYASNRDAFFRTGFGFAGRMAANAFAEFWPDVKNRLIR